MYCAYITTIKEIRKHSNADRLQCATIFGNNVIVDMSYTAGERVVYFPEDGQLSLEFARENKLLREKDENGNNIGGYLDPDKRNITSIRLRGEKSEGLVLPIEVLSKYIDVSKLKDGDRITTLDGIEICRKYIPIIRNTYGGKLDHELRKKEKEIYKYPLFKRHSETEQLAYNKDAFYPGDTCYITLKMHGTSGRTANTIRQMIKKRNSIVKKIFKKQDRIIEEQVYVSGSRKVVLGDFKEKCSSKDEFRKKWHEFFEGKLPVGMEVFYEIVGYSSENTPIMGVCDNKLIKDKEFSKQYGARTVFSYGCNEDESDCYVYRMTMTSADGFVVEIPWEQVQIICEKLGMKCVPQFDKFIFTTWEDLMQRVETYYEGPDPVGKTHIREGVVVRIDNRQTFTAYKHKGFSFKCLSGIIKDKVSTNDSIDDDILSEM